MWTSRARPIYAMALLLCGCASTSIQSNRSAAFEGHVENVFVVVSMAPTTPDAFATTLVQAIASGLSDRGVKVTTYVRDGLELEEPDLRGRVEESGAEAVLVVGQTTASKQGREMVGATFDVSLLDPRSGDRLWRASLEATRKGCGLEKLATDTSDELVERLAADRVIPTPGDRSL